MSADADRWDLPLELLLNLEREVGGDVPDEPDAIHRVASAIRKHVAGICDPSSPLGRFLLVGPNESANKLAASLARILFGDAKKVVRLDMETYAKRHQLSGLIGHTGGIAAGPFEGELTEPIWREPQTVIVLEGIEKAHADVRGLLVQLMREGFLIDGMGRSVSFKQTIFIMTTTIGYVAGDIKADRVKQDLLWQFPSFVDPGYFIDEILLFH